VTTTTQEYLEGRALRGRRLAVFRCLKRTRGANTGANARLARRRAIAYRARPAVPCDAEGDDWGRHDRCCWRYSANRKEVMS